MQGRRGPTVLSQVGGNWSAPQLLLTLKAPAKRLDAASAHAHSVSNTVCTHCNSGTGCTLHVTYLLRMC